MKNLDFSKTVLQGGFWKYYYDRNREVTVGAVYNRFLETGRFAALKCNWQEGQENKPHFYWDSDVAKWIEGVGFLAQQQAVPEWEALVDAMAQDMVTNQREDGYFNSYFQSVAMDKIFSDRRFHELYCLGHMIEAAIAYHKGTGKDALLAFVCKYIDYVYAIFVEQKSAKFTTPGHEEIELALLKLYEYQGNPKHLELAQFFINHRGLGENETTDEYSQSHLPVRQQREAVGHAVRGCYLYTAMAQMARICGDAELLIACDAIFADITNKKMSITGGIGAVRKGEAFSYGYDLPNQEIYNETCAAISLAMFAAELGQLHEDSKYADLVERIYYNGFLSGLSQAGDRFFYVNPLEIDIKKTARESEFRGLTQRSKVFDTSCCPPNIVRMLGSMPRYMYATKGDTVYCNQFAHAVTEFDQGMLTQKTDYPISGKIEFSWQGSPITLKVRIPAWCVEYTGETENGYASFELKDGDCVCVDLPMEVHIMESHPDVQDNAGRYAIMRGPIVYCMEGVDNGENLRDIAVSASDVVRVEMEELPAPVLYMNATRRRKGTVLYQIRNEERVSFSARLIPYFAFANRGESDMIVWIQVK